MRNDIEERVCIYLATPYTSKIPGVQWWRYKNVTWAMSDLIKLGYIVFSPITHSHPIGKDLSWDEWLKQDRWFVDRCDMMVILKMKGWDKSKGVKREWGWFKLQNKPVITITWREINKLLKYPEFRVQKGL